MANTKHPHLSAMSVIKRTGRCHIASTRSSGTSTGAHWSLMKAVPGRGAFAENKLTNAFTNMAEGRGEFALFDSPSNAHWTIAKWRIHLDFLQFNPSSEVEMEGWFDDATLKISANAATAVTTLKVMQLLSPPQGTTYHGCQQ